MSENEFNIMNEQLHRQTLSIGRGTIEPAPHIDRGEYDWDLVDQLEYDLLTDDSLYDKTEMNIPVQCADGRTRWMIGASAIGGTFSTVAADGLGPRKYYDPEASAKQHALSIYSIFRSKGFSVGGHDDDHATGVNCGCGGEDKFGSEDASLLSILGLLGEHGDEIRQSIVNLADSRSGQNLGITVTNAEHVCIVNNARELLARSTMANKYVTNGRALRDAMVEAQDETIIETLHGEHKEVIAELDLRNNGLVLNRAKLAKRYDDKVQVFYINVSSLLEAANQLYDNEGDALFAFKSGLYYNVAASAVLAGPSLRLLTLQ